MQFDGLSAASNQQPSQLGEQRFVLNGVSWEQYERLRAVLDQPGLRMTYLEGVLELMSPSRSHEENKTIIARLLETYALDQDIALNGYGSTTFQRRAKERGVEPDECYMVGASVDAEYNSTPPHIALEVVLSSSGIDKLAVYSGLEVREVWFWDGKQFSLHGLEGSRYVVLERSRFLPELDLTLLALFVGERDQTAAAREYLRRLRGH